MQIEQMKGMKFIECSVISLTSLSKMKSYLLYPSLNKRNNDTHFEVCSPTRRTMSKAKLKLLWFKNILCKNMLNTRRIPQTDKYADIFGQLPC